MPNTLVFYVLIYSLAIAFSLTALVASIRKRRKTPGEISFPFLTLGVLAWSLGMMGSLLDTRPLSVTIWPRLTTLGVDLLPAAWLGLVVTYSRPNKKVSLWLWLFFAAEILISQIMVWTSLVPYALQTRSFLVLSQPLPVIAVNYDVWTAAHLLVAGLILFVGGMLINSAHTQIAKQARGASLVFSISMLLPWFIYLGESAGLNARSGLFLTPLAISLGQIAFTRTPYTTRQASPSPGPFTLMENLFRALMEFSPVAMLVADIHGYIRLVNIKAEEVIGASRKDLIGTPLETLLTERHRELYLRYASDFLNSSNTRPMVQSVDLMANRKDGSEFPVEIGLNAIQTQDGRMLLAYLVDTSQIRRQQGALRQFKRQLNHSLAAIQDRNRELNMMGEMVEILGRCTNPSDAHSVINEFVQHLYPQQSGAIYQFSESRQRMEPIARWGIAPPGEQHLELESCWGVKRLKPHKVEESNGNRLFCQHIETKETSGFSYLCIPMQAQGDLCGLLHVRYPSAQLPEGALTVAETLADQLALALANLEMRRKLNTQSLRDPLTRLYSLSYMDEALKREVRHASRTGSKLGILLLDVDHFAAFNEKFGRQVGDSYLKTLATTLFGGLRQEEIACRAGGDEFCLILVDAGLDDCQRLAEKLRTASRKTPVEHLDRPSKPPTLSIGIAHFPEHGRTPEELLQSARQAMKSAKEKGDQQISLPDSLVFR